MVTPDGPAGQGVYPSHRDRLPRFQFTGAGLQGQTPTAVGGEAEMTKSAQRPRLIVGISGASGAIYGARLLELLRPLPVETHLVMSRSAEVTLALETGLKPTDLQAHA